MAYADKKAAFKYINEYQKGKYDRITIVRKLGDKDALKEIAKEKNMSVNEFVNMCIDEKLARLKKTI